MPEVLSLNEDETVHCYACNHDSDLHHAEVRALRTIGSSVVLTLLCAGCGRLGEVHLDRSDRAGSAEIRAYAVVTAVTRTAGTLTGV